VGVEATLFWGIGLLSSLLLGLTAGRGGLGGGSIDTTPFRPVRGSPRLCWGLAGSAGRKSPPCGGEFPPPILPFTSSLPFLLLATAGCFGGGSYAVWKVWALTSFSG
jgi:hypothetical protein